MIIIFTILFAILSVYRPRIGLFFCLLLLPTYLIRFTVFGVPSTILEIMIAVIVLVWLIKFNKKIIPVLLNLIKKNRFFFSITGLFLLSAGLAVFFSPDPVSALGEWKAWFIEPVVLLLVIVTYPKLSGLKQTDSYINNLIFALILAGLITAIFAVIQHFTGYLVPWAFWENGNSYRVTGWFGYPNGLGLYLAPLIPLAVYLTAALWNKKKSAVVLGMLIIAALFAPLGLLAIVFAKSTGGLVAVLGSLFVLGFCYKTTRWWTVGLALTSAVFFLFLPITNPIKHEILMQDRSGQIRLAMWGEAWEMLRDNPIFGAGLDGYQTRIAPYHKTVNGEGIEIFHHPHNLFLSIWSNTGISGLLCFIILNALLILYLIQQKNRLSYFLLAALAVILIHGLVDTPYLKNDLSVMFWFLAALTILNQKNLSKQLLFE